MRIKSSAKNTTLSALFLASSLLFPGEVLASLFSSGVPAGWISQGNTGTSGADGVVTLAPSGGSQYGWVSTSGGVTGVGLDLGGETNGSSLASPLFSATAGDNLQFFFNFVTSDGAGFADYGWAELRDATNSVVALLFTARTTPSGNSVPGFGMPAIAATIAPSTVVIIPGGPTWAPLGGSSGACFDTGCGYTDWVQSDYIVAASGNYSLKFGVVNSADQQFDTGMAFDGITIGGVAIGTSAVPEPASLALLGIGLASFCASRRRKQIV